MIKSASRAPPAPSPSARVSLSLWDSPPDRAPNRSPKLKPSPVVVCGELKAHVSASAQLLLGLCHVLLRLKQRALAAAQRDTQPTRLGLVRRKVVVEGFELAKQRCKVVVARAQPAVQPAVYAFRRRVLGL